jgi:hypothetical protein
VSRNTRHLTGIRFETLAPPLADTLPRMDVAVFVGFAASGPLQRPVPVEEIAQFSEIFGADIALARAGVRGDISYGNLAGAVRAFFRNGGRRCWIVRVAGASAVANRSPGAVEDVRRARRPFRRAERARALSRTRHPGPCDTPDFWPDFRRYGRAELRRHIPSLDRRPRRKPRGFAAHNSARRRGGGCHGQALPPPRGMGGITITASAKVTVNASVMEISASMLTVNAGLSKFSGVVQAGTVISNSVVSASYTPGAGNI